jgi:purine-binding chemotaxis protein CheW
MNMEMELLIFEAAGVRCALPLTSVIKVESAAELTPLPNAPKKVAGILNVRGQIMPVVDMRRCLRLPARAMRLDDHLILAKTGKRELILWVGLLEGVEKLPTASQDHVAEVLKSLPHLTGVTTLGDELIMIHDLERFLTDEEEDVLTQALGAVEL